MQRKAFHILIFFILGIIHNGCGEKPQHHDEPRAVNGVVNLRGWDFRTQGPVVLDGEWEFYWQQHLSPADFAPASSAPQPRYIDVPGFWNGYRLDGARLPGTGYATYRLTVLLDPPEASLALKLEEVSTAFTLYIGEKPAAFVGLAGRTQATTVPRQLPALAAFQPESDRIEILLQVSNFHHRRGGVWDLITLAPENQARRLNEIQRSYDFFVLGAIFSIAAYHLILFAVRRKFRPTLYFGIVCLLVALRLLTTDERHLLQFADRKSVV